MLNHSAKSVAYRMCSWILSAGIFSPVSGETTHASAFGVVCEGIAFRPAFGL